MALVLLGFYLSAHGTPADDRLAAHSFRNIGESRFALEYPVLNARMIGGHVIPGLHRGFVPQGIDFLSSHPNEVVLSGYFCERMSTWKNLLRRCLVKRSAVYLYDLDAGEAVRLALLEERDGEPMRRHAGGIAELHERLWVPDNFIVFRFHLDELRSAAEPIITMRPENEAAIGVDSSGDFITAFEGRLWIGNFQRGRRGRPLPDHYLSPLTGAAGWTAGYRIDPETLRPTSQSRYRVSFGGIEYEVYRPDAAFHHRNKVQGITFMDDGRVVLSASFGGNLGALSFHRLHGLHGPHARDQAFAADVTLPDGSSLRVDTLALPTREKFVPTPPGAEGITYDGTTLAVAFEGGAIPYRERWRWIEDRMLLLRPPATAHVP
jgi:hypothetical protein